MRRFLIFFALALIPIQGLLYLVWQYYQVPLSLEGAVMRMLGGAVAAGYVAWRIDRQMGGSKRKPGPGKPPPAIYHRVTPDQLARLGGKSPDQGDPAPDAPPGSGEPQSLRDRLRQQQAPED